MNQKRMHIMPNLCPMRRERWDISSFSWISTIHSNGILRIFVLLLLLLLFLSTYIGCILIIWYIQRSCSRCRGPTATRFPNVYTSRERYGWNFKYRNEGSRCVVIVHRYSYIETSMNQRATKKVHTSIHGLYTYSVWLIIIFMYINIKDNLYLICSDNSTYIYHIRIYTLSLLLYSIFFNM